MACGPRCRKCGGFTASPGDEPVLAIAGGLLGLLLLACAVAPSASAVEAASDRVHITTSRLDLVFTLDGASPETWRACHPSCAQANAASGTAIRFTGSDDPPQPRLVLRDAGSSPGLTVDLQRLRFTAAVTEATPARIVTFEADLPVEGVRLVKSFEVSRDGYEVVMTARLLGPNAATFMAGRRLELELGAGRNVYPAPAAGFTAVLDRMKRVMVGGDGVRVLGDDNPSPTPLRAGDWAGFRNRFWAIVARSDGAVAVESRPAAGIALVPTAEPDRLSWRYTVYSGPLDNRALTRADPALGQLLFDGLWSWLRALSFGLLFLLRGWIAVLGHPGVAIIALAFSVKILLLPLATVAERLQEQVNATQARLQPAIDAIQAAHKGEERVRRTVALYREARVHPLYTLKSLLGFLIQFPVFIAVFDMLAEDFDLYRVPFLWIPDLSRPDDLLRLPFCLPFFGCYLNLLPFLMSGISAAALLRYHSPVLTPALVRRQRRNLLGMTLLFFLLFYTFPAGMVLYWTSTNAFQLVSQELGRLRRLWRRPRAVA
jgi:YidC/Oxa1 family membrane protein insertase